MILRTSPLLVLVIALAALPACSKKPEAASSNTSAPSDKGSDAGKKAEIEAKAMDTKNLPKLAVAFAVYSANYNGRMPSSGGVPDTSMNLYSWRVEILPHIGINTSTGEQTKDPLVGKFKTDEPWDSAQNKLLIDQMPAVYKSRNAEAPPGMTRYKVFVGGGALFDPKDPPRFPASIADGTSNTILAIEADPPVIWSKPEDIPYDPNKPLPELKLNGKPIVNVVMVDSSAYTIDLSKVSEKTLRAAITRAGNDILGPDWEAAIIKPSAVAKSENWK